jgi:2-methylcitrate dehydratase PrpD
MTSLTADLANHIVGYRDSKLDGAAITVAKSCVLDWFGVTLAGSREPLAQILQEEIIRGSQGGATIVGTALQCAPAAAALVNGATSHALDYDDVHVDVGHPTAPILPAALAVGETEGSTGAEILKAFIAGYEAAAFIGSLMIKSHYARGFHSTGTLGSFGAAAAAGILMGLDADRMAIALGLAGTQASGLKSMFGTMAKPLHAGLAAENGVRAARLAALGFTAAPNVLEVAQGFIATQSDVQLPKNLRLPRRGSLILNNLFKYHAACYLTHSSIEAIRGLRTQLSLDVSDLASLDIVVPDGHLAVCNIEEPSTGLETKFSLRHTAALAVSGMDTASILSYTDQNARDAQLSAIRRSVMVHGGAQGSETHVIMKTRSGKTGEAKVDVGIPHANLQEQHIRVVEKFRLLSSPVLGLEESESLKTGIETIDKAPNVRALLGQAAAQAGDKTYAPSLRSASRS